MAAKKRAPAKPESKPVEVITLRIRPDTKQRLLAHCQKRSKAESRQISYNQAIIDLIEQTA